MPAIEEELLVGQLDGYLRPLNARKVIPTPTIEAVELIAAWKTGWPRQGVGVVSIGSYSDHPGEFAAKLQRRIGWRIGYFPVFLPMQLHVVVTGRGILPRATELQLHLSTVNNFS